MSQYRDFFNNKKIKNQNYHVRNCFLKIAKITKPHSESAAYPLLSRIFRVLLSSESKPGYQDLAHS